MYLDWTQLQELESESDSKRKKATKEEGASVCLKRMDTRDSRLLNSCGEVPRILAVLFDVLDDCSLIF